MLGVPVIIAGDIFDKWNAPAELINFAMGQLNFTCDAYAIPGQHDLPSHNYDDIRRSAYWTLVEAGLIQNLLPNAPEVLESERGAVELCGFPWGYDIKAPKKKSKYKRLAVCHSFIYNQRTGYKGAPESGRVENYQTGLQGFDAAVFGDNHKGFLTSTGNGPTGNLLNCGTFMRRKADEIRYRPSIGLLHADFTINRVLLDTEGDQFISMEEATELVETAIDLTDFAGALASLSGDGLSFVSAVRRFLDRNNITETVRTRVLEAMDNADD